MILVIRFMRSYDRTCGDLRWLHKALSNLKDSWPEPTAADVSSTRAIWIHTASASTADTHPTSSSPGWYALLLFRQLLTKADMHFSFSDCSILRAMTSTSLQYQHIPQKGSKIYYFSMLFYKNLDSTMVFWYNGFYKKTKEVRPMTDTQQRLSAKQFMKDWTGHGDEKQEAAIFNRISPAPSR